jgi:hypothetical protein
MQAPVASILQHIGQNDDPLSQVCDISVRRRKSYFFELRYGTFDRSIRQTIARHRE